MKQNYLNLISAIGSILMWLAIVLLVATGLRLSGDIFWQYIFFLRSPIFMGVLLLALPGVAVFILPSILKNLFVLPSVWQVAFTILGATVAGMSIVLVAAIIMENAPARFGIEGLEISQSISPLIPQLEPYLLAMLLALPTTLAVTKLSAEEIGNKRWQGLFLGISLSGIFLFFFELILKAINNSSNPFVVKLFSRVNNIFVSVISILGENYTVGYINCKTGNLTDEHLDAFIFFILLLSVYLVIFKFFKPISEPSKGRPEVPALLYVMLLISITTLFLGNLTFYFDYWRVSVLLFLLLISVLMYWQFKVDHFFELFELKEDTEQPKETTDFLKLVEKRLQKDTLVVVCASGGGIQAAGWTTQVLTSLQADECLGKSFTKAIGLISSVSGGSIGTMYYLDRFTDKGFPEDTEQIFNSATKNSLDAVGWGLAYPDLWRIISLPMLTQILTPQISDRGIALEKDLQGEMQTPNKPKTLETWRKEISQGKIPIPVFNATIVENGFRLLITPMNFGKSEEKKFYDFNSLYPNYDIKVVTAGRLSATFPYVSPVCRDNKERKNFHIADGGYFDNSGFVTAVEWLNELLEESQKSQEKKIKRVLLLQINPFPKNSSASDTIQNRGLFMATLGPLLTLFKVRDPILNTRNFTEAKLLKQKWQQVSKTSYKQGIDIQYHVINFPSLQELQEFYKKNQKEVQEFDNTKGEYQPAIYNQKGEYRPPLSWKLTQNQKNAIKNGWDAIKGKKQIQELKTLWRDTWKID